MKPHDDSTLRERAILNAALSGHSPCLSIDQLAALDEGRLAPHALASARVHLDACPKCRAELDLFHNFQAAEASPGEAADLAWISNQLKPTRQPAPPPPTEARLPWWRTLFAPSSLPRLAWVAASVLVLVSVSLYLRGTRQPALDLPGNDPGVLRSAEIRLLAPTGDLTAIPTQFQWQPVPGAARYEIRLLEIDRTEIFKASATAATLPVPGDLSPRITPRKTLLWQVSAFSPDGRKLAESPLTQFRLTP